MTEKISGLLDGELRAEEFGPAWQALDADDLKTIERYQLIGAIMRNDCSDVAVRMLKVDVASRISERIDSEPSWLLPASGRRRPARRLRASGTSRPAFFGGFAAAAAVAALAVFIVAPGWLDDPQTLDAPLVSTEGAASSADMNALNTMLVEHGEFTGSAGLNGLVAYAKFVSQDDR
ncbi:MAG: hypothetical protein DWQ08_14920 [Proteobacteria bacterium]|nr:MAG: hypothetical protein DWQ08_14920 [Pseudomonadota bacterium]